MLPFVEKYRPSDMSDILSQENTISTIQQFITKDSMPHLLFYGAAGTGKSTMARAVAKQMYNNTSQVLELNASDERGISVVREQIRDFSMTRALDKHKLIILDEADSLNSK